MKFIFLFLLVFNCTNYSKSKTRIVAPILVSATSSSGDYNVKVRVTNQEPLLAGYKLYIGNNETEARTPPDLTAGVDCSNIVVLPNFPLEYSFDIKTNSSTSAVTANAICIFRTNNATKGKYIAIRSLVLSITPSNQTNNRINPSLPSNSLILP